MIQAGKMAAEGAGAGAGSITGILGGSFDPPHRGHRHIALEAFRALGLDRLYLVPAYHSPLKTGHYSRAEERLAMLEIMCASLRAEAGQRGREVLILSDELDRRGASYTWETLENLQKRHPADILYLIVGDDILPDLPRWKNWRRIFAVAKLAVFARTGHSGLPQELEDFANSVHFIRNDIHHLSSTELRKTLHQKKSVKNLLNQDVYRYIKEHSIYTD